MAADRRRRMVSTFDREPNKPINAKTVLAAVRRERIYGACKFAIARVLRARPNSRTFDAVQRELNSLRAERRIKVAAIVGGVKFYYDVQRRRR